MPYQDMPRSELERYKPAQVKEPDLESFWSDALAAVRAERPGLDVTPLDYPVNGVAISRATYSGLGSAPISGWLLAPDRSGRTPAIVFYHGYGWHKLDPTDYLGWVLQGYTVFAVDVRGQPGHSGDPAPYPGGHAPGFMTKGILDPRAYYYRHAYADAVRAVDVVADLPSVDPSHIGVAGASQGGGLSLAVAALHGSVRTAMAGVPFLCHFERAVEMADEGPYLELVHYFKIHRDDEAAAFRTLRYVDVLNLADRITCPTLVTVGLRDPICPPSTIYAVYNTIPAHDKRLDVYPYDDHDLAMGSTDAQVRWAARYLR